MGTAPTTLLVTTLLVTLLVTTLQHNLTTTILQTYNLANIQRYNASCLKLIVKVCRNEEEVGREPWLRDEHVNAPVHQAHKHQTGPSRSDIGMFSVVWPAEPLAARGFSRLRVPVSVSAPGLDSLPDLHFKVPYFVHNGVAYVLVKDLAALWNYPSSYQVISRLVKGTGLPKSAFLKASDAPLNELLVRERMIGPSDVSTRVFYIELQFVYNAVENKDVLVGEPQPRDDRVRKYPLMFADDDMITVSQVFPQYGIVESTLPLNHASFLALNPLTKLQVYKHDGNYRRVYGTSLSAHERELILQNNNYSKYDALRLEPAEPAVSSARKPLGRLKKHVGNVDPNALDVAESMLPGSGLIPEFNVSAICKVPNYFVTNNQMSAAQQSALFNPQVPHLSLLKMDFNETGKLSKQLHQLLVNNDQEAYHSKYYYFKSYRGPGSGNYKDAALVNRINRIKRFTASTDPTDNKSTHLPAHKVTKPVKWRSNRAIKGLTHEYFSNENVDVVIARQRRFTEDFTNLEMLHNNVLFNLLVNSYREVAADTWRCFYKFKMVDYEKLYLIEQTETRKRRRAELLAEQAKRQQHSHTQVVPTPELSDLLRPDLTLRFTLPTAHREIVQLLPVELRGQDDDPATSISKPIRYVATYPDKTMPELLNQIEVVKLPNANSLAWDNFRKYRRE